VFLIGAISTTARAVAQVRSYVQVEAEVIGTVHPSKNRGSLPRELFELTLADGRTVQAYGAVVGQSASPGTIKKVYYDPTDEFARTYEQDEGGQPNTGAVYTTIVSVIFAPTLLWMASIVVFGLTFFIRRLNRSSPEGSPPDVAP
jgi:hypothetical protein